MKALHNDLNSIGDENGSIRCEGRLKLVPLRYDAKTNYLINSNHYLAKLIVEFFHSDLKHVTIKQTLFGLRQKFSICRSRSLRERFLTLIRLGLLRVIFFWEDIILFPTSYSRRTYLMPIQLYAILKQSIESTVKVKKCSNHLL